MTHSEWAVNDVLDALLGLVRVQGLNAVKYWPAYACGLQHGWQHLPR